MDTLSERQGNDFPTLGVVLKASCPCKKKWVHVHSLDACATPSSPTIGVIGGTTGILALVYCQARDHSKSFRGGSIRETLALGEYWPRLNPEEGIFRDFRFFSNNHRGAVMCAWSSHAHTSFARNGQQ